MYRRLAGKGSIGPALVLGIAMWTLTLKLHMLFGDDRHYKELT